MDRYTFLAIVWCFIFLSAVLLHTGITHNEWTGFLVSEFHLVICALGTYALLKQRSPKNF